ETAPGYGKLVVIDHGYGYKTYYGHNSKILVKVGQRVKRGERIAAVGNTGTSTGSHLHYEVRLNGVSLNPKKYI
ncbi:MAG: M23 family metallopeptidase, partial [Desulfuromonadales bacterium]|nr:M23 family metallopeptidase [Desulfuromonadales bacterium]